MHIRKENPFIGLNGFMTNHSLSTLCQSTFLRCLLLCPVTIKQLFCQLTMQSSFTKLIQIHSPSMRTQITQNYWTEALSLLNEVAMSRIPISNGTGTWNREKANKVCSLRKLHPHQPLYCGAGKSQSDCIITAGRVLQKGKLRQVNSNVNSSPSADFQLSISRALIDDY